MGGSLYEKRLPRQQHHVHSVAGTRPTSGTFHRDLCLIFLYRGAVRRYSLTNLVAMSQDTSLLNIHYFFALA